MFAISCVVLFLTMLVVVDELINCMDCCMYFSKFVCKLLDFSRIVTHSN